jgi:hypothetical protein
MWSAPVLGMTSSAAAEGSALSGVLGRLLEVEAANERDLAASRAEATRILDEARDRERREDEALARDVEEMRRGVSERLEAERKAKLDSFASQGRAGEEFFAQLTEERADELAAAIVKRLLEEEAPP